MSSLKFNNILLLDMRAAAASIIKHFPEERFFVMRGEMGAGKTTLIKLFCECLGVKSFTSSPTFALVNEYFSEMKGIVYHFDFYRIKSVIEVYDIGYEEYFFGNQYCFIEWAEKIPELLPDEYVEVKIDYGDENRTITASLIQRDKN